MTGVSANPNAEREMLEAAEMRWMSMEDATITVRARLVAELGRDRDLLARALRLASERIVSLRQTSPFTRIATDEVPLAVESVLAGLLREATET